MVVFIVVASRNMEKEFINDNAEKAKSREERINKLLNPEHSQEIDTIPILPFEREELEAQITNSNDKNLISEIKQYLSNLEEFDYPPANQDTATLGSKIRIKYFFLNEPSEEQTYIITGISQKTFGQDTQAVKVTSPIGKILIGKKVGEIFDLELARNNSTKIQVLSIEQMNKD